MTRKELRLALRYFEDRGAYSLRLFLDNRTSVLAHQWFLEDGDPWDDEPADDEPADDGREGVTDGTEGLLRVSARGRQALIAISRIVGIELVPFG